MTELAWAGLLAVGFLGILATAEVVYRVVRPPVEVTRKGVHLASGLPVLAFPWVFESPWTVVALSVFIGGVLLVSRRAGVLESVTGVERSSRGELLYPLGIVVVFFVGHDQPVFYFVSVLVLIVSDPTAALIGLSYGRTRYDVEDHWRSLEGSVGFFLMTFLAVHLPLLLMTGLDPAVTLLVGLVVAILVTLFEAICLHGADNLAIPVASYLLLEQLTPASPAELSFHLGVLVTMLVFLTVLSRGLHFMKASGVMAATLYFYVVFALAGPVWLLPPALGMVALAAFRATMHSLVPLPDAKYQVVAIMYAATPSLVLVLGLHVPALGRIGWWPDHAEAWAAALAGAIAGQVAIMCATQFDPFNPELSRWMPPGRLLLLVAGAVAVVVPVSLQVTAALSVPAAATAAAVAVAGAFGYWYTRTATTWPAEPPWNFRLQAAATTAAGVAAVFLSAGLWR